MKIICERIMSLRKENHLTQAQLGEISGLHSSNISRIEQGNVFPSGDVVLKMANYFNVSCDYILGRVVNDDNDRVGYIMSQSDKLQIIEISEDERLKELKQLYCEYTQLSEINRRELLEYIKIKIKFQNQSELGKVKG